MEFSPSNPIVKLCIEGMDMEGKGHTKRAAEIFMQAWNEATNDFEKFIAAHYVARQQAETAGRLQWLEKGLQLALSIDDSTVRSALPSLYLNIAGCYDSLGNAEQASENRAAAASAKTDIADDGPFYHGTRADLQVGDMLTAGRLSNYQDHLVMNHIYFTGMVNGAGLAAALSKGNGRERVYVVEPTGDFEHDPNVTDKKFPGNTTRSYRTTLPLKIVGEVHNWQQTSPEVLQQLRDKLATNKGDIIN